MTCHVIRHGGVRMIVCVRGRRQRRLYCAACGSDGEFLCDFPTPRRSSGTCDKPLCRRCAIQVGEDRHHCPGHQLELAL